MANPKRTLASTVYVPNGGVNFDQNSLAIKSNECTDILNMRIFPDRVQTRSGSRRICGATPSGDPVIHLHPYRDADGQRLLFGFTKDDVFEMDEGAQTWSSVLAVPLANDQSFWSTTNFTDLSEGTTVIAAGSNPPNPLEPEGDGSTRVLLFYNRTSGMFETLVQKTELRDQINEDIGTGDGATDTFTGNLLELEIEPNTINITAVDVSDNLMTVTDNGLGGLIGDVGAGTNTINYVTGAFDVTFSADVKDTFTVEADYSFFEFVDQLPRFVHNFHNRVVMTHIFDNDLSEYFPWRVQWSEIGDFERFDQALGFNDLVDNDLSPITGGDYLQRLLCIFRESSIVNVQFIGGASTFSFNTQWLDGTFSGATVARWQNRLYYLGKDDIYRYDGSQSVRLGKNRIRNRILDIMNNERIQFQFASFYPRFNEYQLGITEVGETYPSTFYIYSEELNAWSCFEFDEVPSMSLWQSISGVTIDELIGTIDEQNWQLNSGLLSGTALAPIITNITGEVFILDERLNSDYANDAEAGDPIPIVFQSRDFVFQDLPRIDRVNQLDFEALGTNVDISLSVDYGKTFELLQNITLDPSYSRRRYWLDRNSQHIRFRIVATEISQFFSMRWMQVLAITREKN